jgi:uncharacterized phiE125 gp8 family phage protein
MQAIFDAPPAALLDELKAWLRIEDNNEDALLFQILRSSTEMIEKYIGKILLARDVIQIGTPKDAVFPLFTRPFLSLTSVDKLSENGVFDQISGQIKFDWNGDAVIVITEGAPGRVRVRYRAGMGDGWNDIPEALRIAVIRLAAHFHGNRDGIDDPGLPTAVTRMLLPYRDYRIGSGVCKA